MFTNDMFTNDMFTNDMLINEEDMRKDLYYKIDELTKDDNNYTIFFMLNASGYLNFFTDDEKYFLFVSSCLHNSINIMKILLTTNFSKDGLKNFMVVYLSELNEFNIFKWIYENYDLKFSEDQIDHLFFNIIKTNNYDFLEWFLNKKIINLNRNNFYDGGFICLKDKIYDILDKFNINSNIKKLIYKLY